MSERDEDTEGTEEPRQLGPRAARKAAQEAARAALEARVDAAPVDVGQFDGLPEPSTGARARVLAACERVARGATLADAAVLDWMEANHRDIDVELHQGGQPLYPYYIGIE